MIPELRCTNPDCRSRRNGARGKLLGQELTEGQVTLYCNCCRRRQIFDADRDPPERDEAA